MLLKLLLKIWPSLVPIFAYIFWVYIVEGIVVNKVFKKLFQKRDSEKDKTVDAEYEVVGEKSTKQDKLSQESEEIGKFSLKNRCFLGVIYLSLILSILSLIATALT